MSIGKNMALAGALAVTGGCGSNEVKEINPPQAAAPEGTLDGLPYTGDFIAEQAQREQAQYEKEQWEALRSSVNTPADIAAIEKLKKEINADLANPGAVAADVLLGYVDRSRNASIQREHCLVALVDILAGKYGLQVTAIDALNKPIERLLKDSSGRDSGVRLTLPTDRDEEAYRQGFANMLEAGLRETARGR